MAFIPIDARADVSGSKKGKITPAQHAQLNAFTLANKTGILDCGNHCESTATIYSVSDGAARVYFKTGYVAICGRFIECEEGSYVDVPAPTVGTVSGKIILRFNLSNSGVEEFKVTTTTEALVQQDLNDYPTTGIYELELYNYTATPTTVSLTRNDSFVMPVSDILHGMFSLIADLDERLTNLGFKEGNIIYSGNIVGKIYRQGNFVVIYKTGVQTRISAYSGHEITISPIGNATLSDFRPSETVTLQHCALLDGDVPSAFVVSIDTTPKIIISNRSRYDIWLNRCSYGYEVPPISSHNNIDDYLTPINNL